MMNDIGDNGPVQHPVQKPAKHPIRRLLLLWALLLCASLAIWQFLTPEAGPSLVFTDFMYLVRADPAREPYVEEVSLQGRVVTAWVRNPETKKRTRYTTIGPERMEGLVAELEAQHVSIGYEIDTHQRMSDMAFTAGGTGFLSAWVALYLAMKARREVGAASARLTQVEAELARRGDPHGPPPHGLGNIAE